MSRSRFLAAAAATGALVSGAALAPAGASAAQKHSAYVANPASLVNPMIGTSNGGDTFPGADMPFGMIQWSPDTSPDRPSGGGYEYTDKAISGYSLTHMSGPGCGAEDDIPILPTTGAIPTDPADATSPLNHADESATPGSYSLTSNGIQTQLATTMRAGIAKFSFPTSSSSGNLLFKLSDSGAPDTNEHFQVVSSHEVSGYVTTGEFCGATNQYTLHFDMTFNKPIKGYGTWQNGSSAQAGVKSQTLKLNKAQIAAARAQAKVAGQQALASKGLPGSRTSANGKLRAASSASTSQAHARTGRSAHARSRISTPAMGADGAYVTFDTGTSGTVQARVGISFVDNDNASANLAQEIPSSASFASVQSAAHKAWNSALGKIQVGGGSATQQTTFYTGLYHSLLHPNVISDDNGQYPGFDGQMHTTSVKHPIYANYSGWDIYRSQTQLESMLFPNVMSDTVTSMLDDYDQTGELPKWSEDNGESYVMVGDPSDEIISDAYAFGVRGFNVNKALKDMETEANLPNNVRPGLNYYLNDGYLPIDGSYGCCNYYGPVSTQEEYNAADNSIAELASATGDTATANTFATRANNWQNSYNPGSGFLQPKLMDGSFQSGFDPTSSNGFVEADAYVYAAELPFDVGGLVAAEGGDNAWATRLDGLTRSVTGMTSTEAQLGNEPSFDIPWEYDYVGQPYKAQNVAREVQDDLYTNSPTGLAGNDDLGAMSSWLVFSMLGGYPETPGSSTLALGSPAFTNVDVHLGDGKQIVENAPQATDSAPYVQSMTVNGQAWNNAYLPSDLVTNGGTVDWTLGTTKNPAFGNTASAAPPSNESGLDSAIGFVKGDNGDSLEVVQPGSSANLTLGVQSLSAKGQTIGWTATTTSGSGLQVAATSGSFTVGSEKQATQQIGLSVPSGTPDGKYQVTFQLHTATGTPLPSVVEDIGVASPGDLTPYYNDTGISSDSNQSVADFDGDGFSYSEQALQTAGVTIGAPVNSSDGIKYTFSSAPVGTPDSITAGGQTIAVLPVSGATKIGLLGSATNGPSTGTLTINYTDGTTQPVKLDFSDWTLGANPGGTPVAGNVEVAKTPYRNSTGGTSQTVDTFLFSQSIPIAAGKTVQSLTLPSSTDQGSLHFFSFGSDAGPLTK